MYMCVYVYENMAGNSRQKYGGKVWDTHSADLFNSVGDPCNGYCDCSSRGLTNFITGQKTVWDATRRTSCGQIDRLVRTDRQTHTDRQTVTVTVTVYSSGQTVTVKRTDMCTCVNVV